MKILKRKFFERKPDIVAKQLLGKIFVRKINKKIISGEIIETESYFGKNDPASRAYKKKNLNFYNRMAGTPGCLLIYMVHNNWLLNIVAHKKKEVGAVLIRAVNPIDGIEIMKKNTGKKDIKHLADGPGKFTKSFGINKSFEKLDITKGKEVFIIDKKKNVKIHSSKRIGVKKDMNKNYRFYVNSQ